MPSCGEIACTSMTGFAVEDYLLIASKVKTRVFEERTK